MIAFASQIRAKQPTLGLTYLENLAKALDKFGKGQPDDPYRWCETCGFGTPKYNTIHKCQICMTKMDGTA